MSHAGHFREICACGKVIRQCKCMDLNKETRHGTCNECKAAVPELQDGWCAYHHVIESWQAGSIICGECWHTFLTPEALIEAHNAWGGSQVSSVDEVWFCPVCSHDF